jgi:hypothetical protein
VHVNPYPNVSAPGQRQVCEAGKQGFVPGTSIGNLPPGQVATGAEFTTRGTDLFGESYSATQLKALGLGKGKKK